MIHVVRFHRTGGPEVLQIEDVKIRDPGANEGRSGLHRLPKLARRRSPRLL